VHIGLKLLNPPEPVDFLGKQYYLGLFSVSLSDIYVNYLVIFLNNVKDKYISGLPYFSKTIKNGYFLNYLHVLIHGN